MEGTNATATLSLEISTGNSLASLQTLNAEYATLHANLAKGVAMPGTQKLDADLKEIKTGIGSVTAAMDALTKRGTSGAQAFASGYAQSFGGFSQSIKLAAADTKEKSEAIVGQIRNIGTAARDLAVKQIPISFKIDRNLGSLGAIEGDVKRAFEASAQYSRAWAEAHATNLSKARAAELKYGDSVVAAMARRNEQAQKYDVDLYNQRSAAEARLKSIQETRDTQTHELGVAKYARRNELVEKYDLELYLQRSAAEARLKSIQEARDTQTYELGVAKYARRNELIEKYDLELYLQRSAAEARLKSIQEGRDTELYNASVAAHERQLAMERKYILASNELRLKAALDARKLMDAGYKGNLSHEFAPSTLAQASNSTVLALQAQLAAVNKLGPATRVAAGHQQHWNTIAHEANGAARGLSGALGGLWLTYGSLAPLLAAASLAGSMKSLFTVGKELEFQFSVVSAISDGATVDVKKFSDAVAGSMSTPIEAAKGLRVLAQAGLSVSEATEALPSVLKLAAVGETDMATAALSATAIMHAFGLSVSDFGHIGDVFAKAAAISATSVTEMMQAMRQASAASDLFGVSVEELGATLATLANRGIEGSAAGTAITNMLREMSSPRTARASAAMKEFGISMFNADGTTKTFVERLQQLQEATAGLSAKGKATFLDDTFNNRSAKAASILLKDFEKLKSTLDDLRLSSEGLGFMSEANIKISQSTDGLLKTLASSFQTTLGGAFTAVQPQIAELIRSLTDVVSSSDFKDFITSTAKAVLWLTDTLKDNIDTIKILATAYLSMKAFDLVSAGAVLLAKNIGLVVTGMRSLAVIDFAATAAASAAAATTAAAATAAAAASSTGVVASQAGLMATVLKNVGFAASALLSPFSLAVAGVGALGVAGYKLYESLTKVSDSAKEGIEALRGYAQATSDVAREVEKGNEELRKSGKLLDAQIDLLSQGKTAADAYAQATRNQPAVASQARLEKSKDLVAELQARVTAGPAVTPDSSVFSRAVQKQQDINALAEATKTLNKELSDHQRVLVGVGLAREMADDQAYKKKLVSSSEAAKALNDQLEAIKVNGENAAKSLDKGDFKLGLDKEQAAAAESRLQKLVDLQKKTSGLLAKPLGTDPKGSLATPEEVQARKVQIDALLDNSYETKRGQSGGGREASSLFKNETSEIIKGYAARVKAANEEFSNYKELLEQRVKFGAIPQQAETVLLKEAKDLADAKTDGLRALEKQELSTLLATKGTTEVEQVSIRTRLEEISALQAADEAKRSHIALLSQERGELERLAQQRKLTNDIASFSTQEQLSRDRAKAQDYLKRNGRGEGIAGVEAYYATIERGQGKLKEYEAAIRNAEAAQAALSSQIKSGSVANNNQYAALHKLGTAQGSSLTKYDTLFSQAAVQYSVDEALLKAVTYVESRGNAKAVSTQGAKGLMQLMPATARSLGVQDSFDPEQNISGGAKLLKENLATSKGDVDTALMMYHGGTNRSQWGEKTKEYVALVKKAYEQLTTVTKSQIKTNEGLTTSIDQVDASHLASSEAVKNAGMASGEYTETLKSQGSAVDESVAGQEAQAAAFAEAANAVSVAKDAHAKYQAVIEEEAQANAKLAESLRGPEEAVKRMAEAFSASSAVMGATLSARNQSGYYTELEGLRALGNVNKEKIAQLSQLKSAYEAMGSAGAAAAKQVEAQMIELSAHLDPVADKIRGMFESAFENFFNEVVQGTKTIKEAFKDLGKSILKSLGEMVAKNASQELMKLLGGGLEPGKSQGLFSLIGNLFSPNGAGSAGSDIAATGRSIFSSISGAGQGFSASLNSIGSGAARSAGGSTLPSIGIVGKEISELGRAANDSVMHISSIGGAIDTLGVGFGTLGNSVQALSLATSTVGAGFTTLGATTVTTEAAVAASAVSSTLADVSLASTAVAANAAAAGLSTVATTSYAQASESTFSSVLGAVGGVALRSANGNVFSGSPSLHQYVNTVQTSPQNFAYQNLHGFAKGGVFAEAGPEAVMPLTRDHQGRLGVKAQNDSSGPVSIVVHVNGNSNAPDVRRAAGQGAREALNAFNGARRYA